MTMVDEQVSTCDPRLCAEADRAHQHCSCGLPMGLGDVVCALCRMEELDPVEHPSQVVPDDPREWDGLSYPSRRRHRVGCGAAEPYLHLLLMVLRARDPDEERPEPKRRRRAPRRGRRSASSSLPDTEAV